MELTVSITLKQPLLTHYIDRSRITGKTLEQLITADISTRYAFIQRKAERKRFRDNEYERL